MKHPEYNLHRAVATYLTIALKALQRVVHEEMRRQRAERFEQREAA